MVIQYGVYGASAAACSKHIVVGKTDPASDACFFRNSIQQYTCQGEKCLRQTVGGLYPSHDGDTHPPVHARQQLKQLKHQCTTDEVCGVRVVVWDGRGRFTMVCTSTLERLLYWLERESLTLVISNFFLKQVITRNIFS